MFQKRYIIDCKSCKLFCGFLFLMLLILKPAQGQTNDVIVVSGNLLPPYLFINKAGKVDGALKDIYEGFSKFSGKTIRFKISNFKQNIENNEKLHADMQAGMFETPDRKKKFDFTKNDLFDVSVSLFVTPKLMVSSLDALGGIVVGVEKGSYAEADLSRHHPKVLLKSYPNFYKLMNAAMRGEIVAFVDDFGAVKVYLKSRDAVNKFVYVQTLYSKPVKAAVVKGTHKKLLAEMDAYLASRSDAQIKEVRDKWIKASKGWQMPFWTLPSIIVFFVFLLLIMLSFYSMILTRSVKLRTTELEEANKKLQIMAHTDRLTGLNNRLFIDEALDYELRRSKRYRRPFSIILFDIDRFKSVNDTYGHAVGDSVLVMVSAICKSNIRVQDVIGRWGGEEFLVLCPETNAKQAYVVAEKLCRFIAQHETPQAGSVTASFGVAEWCRDEGLTQLVSRADRALYEAKGNGRNQVVVSEFSNNEVRDFSI